MKWMEKVKKIPRKRVISLIGCICFLLILWSVFAQTTYIFRNGKPNTWRMSGFKQEEHDPDLFYVGGSAAYTNWFPMVAWNTHGVASYCLATSSIQAENVKPYIEYARSYKDTKLFVIDARPFEYYSGKEDELGIRSGTDGMDLTSPYRYELLREYFSRRQIPEGTDVLSYYLDIAKYHTNISQLGDEGAWGNRRNDRQTMYKGGWPNASFCALETPRGFETQIRGELDPNARELLVELLEYGKKENLEFLFVVCPYYIYQPQQMMYNTIADIVASYGQGFLNANEYYEEMGIDFSRDFADDVHGNVSGGEKYTAFLTEYLRDRYNLPDHREDQAYGDWWESDASFEKDMAATKEQYQYYLEQSEKAGAVAQQMRETEDILQWLCCAESDLFTLAVVSGDVAGAPARPMDQEILEKLHLDAEKSWQMRLLWNGETVLSNAGTDLKRFRGDLAYTGTRCGISVEDGKCFLWTDAVELEEDSDAINLVVLNSYSGAVEDCRRLRFSPEGELIFSSGN